LGISPLVEPLVDPSLDERAPAVPSSRVSVSPELEGGEWSLGFDVETSERVESLLVSEPEPLFGCELAPALVEVASGWVSVEEAAGVTDVTPTLEAKLTVPWLAVELVPLPDGDSLPSVPDAQLDSKPSTASAPVDQRVDQESRTSIVPVELLKDFTDRTCN
jgi:hypothetical protein